MIDQNGEPVASANVRFGVIDQFDAEGSHYEAKSNDQGEFTISGIHGAVLTVGTWKDGFYNIDGRSDGSFAYGASPDSTRRSPPTQQKPALFVLHKAGISEPLWRSGGGQIDIPATGASVKIDLQRTKPGRGGLEIQSWVSGSNKRPFDWKYRLSVPGGGILERTDKFDFQAPQNGYQESAEINMPATSAEWMSRIDKEYFVKLPNNAYARFSIRFYPGKRNFVVMESFLNPTVGNRNLEFDPKKQVNVGKK